MNEKELAEKLEKRYGIIFPKGYIHFALTFNELDKNLKGLQTHHVCPRCCGGGNENDARGETSSINMNKAEIKKQIEKFK